MKKKWSLALVVVVALLGGCAKTSTTKPDGQPTTIHVSAAASLKDALGDIEHQFEAKHPKTKVDIDYAGSGQIVQRVKAGAPVDGVVLASLADAQKLTKAELTEQQARVAGNDLVLIANKKTTTKPLAADQVTGFLQQTAKIAIGDVASVPAGVYAKQTLTKLALYAPLEAKLVFAHDVRQVLAYVAAGNAQAGFVYRTDAKISDQVAVLYAFPKNLHDDIGYYSSRVKAGKADAQTSQFLDYLQTKPAQQVLADYGFKVD